MVSEISVLYYDAILFEGLNPCSCGGWSQRSMRALEQMRQHHVLILVLVEDGLRVL